MKALQNKNALNYTIFENSLSPFPQVNESKENSMIALLSSRSKKRPNPIDIEKGMFGIITIQELKMTSLTSFLVNKDLSSTSLTLEGIKREESKNILKKINNQLKEENLKLK